MEKEIICVGNGYIQKYYFDEKFSSLPGEVKKSLQVIAVCLSEKLKSIIEIGFYDDGSVYIENSRAQDDFDFDEIASKYEIRRIEREEEELFEGLTLWYNTIYKR